MGGKLTLLDGVTAVTPMSLDERAGTGGMEWLGPVDTLCSIRSAGNVISAFGRGELGCGGLEYLPRPAALRRCRVRQQARANRCIRAGGDLRLARHSWHRCGCRFARVRYRNDLFSLNRRRRLPASRTTSVRLGWEAAFGLHPELLARNRTVCFGAAEPRSGHSAELECLSVRWNHLTARKARQTKQTGPVPGSIQPGTSLGGKVCLSYHPGSGLVRAGESRTVLQLESYLCLHGGCGPFCCSACFTLAAMGGDSCLSGSPSC